MEAAPFKLDLKGLKCPLPVLKTRRKMRDLQSGNLLEVETTDPLASIDIPHMCNEDGYELVSSHPHKHGHHFLIRKR
jgi:tRNA 2-thiouridine synthesizing protein A